MCTNIGACETSKSNEDFRMNTTICAILFLLQGLETRRGNVESKNDSSSEAAGHDGYLVQKTSHELTPHLHSHKVHWIVYLWLGSANNPIYSICIGMQMQVTD